MIRFNDIVEKVQGYHPKADISLLQRAYVYSAKVHGGQVRASGEPYLMHPVEVAGMLAELRMDVATVATGLLHDTVEDTLATVDQIREMFGEEVAYLVDGVTKLSKVHFRTREERQAESFRKMVLAMSKDIRIILVKLCDRLHNMRTIEHLKPEKRVRVAEETIDIYAPIAGRLGIQFMKSELEDLSFKVMMPEVYEDLAAKVELKKAERTELVTKVAEQVRAKLKESDIDADVYGRAKHLYSIFKKMHDSHVELDEIYDIMAIRTIVSTVRECYETLGIVHSMYTPVPGRLKDYIALPKPNLYQSLHTTLITPGGQPVEIQIRTRQMHQVAEQGVAAHWLYKEGGGAGLSTRDTSQFSWLRNMVEAGTNISDSGEFMESLKFDLFPDEVYVFTPKGDVRMLPRGATPIDFAFSVHSDVGLQCIGAKVNGAIVPLEHALKDGDIISIQTRQNHKPSKDWLKVVKTSKARSRLREYFRTEERARAIEIGKEIIERELQKHEMSASSMDKAELNRTADKLGYRDSDRLLIAVSYDTIPAAKVIEHLMTPEQRAALKSADSPVKKIMKAFRNVGEAPRKSTGVRVQGHDDVLVRYAKCCAPLPGDKIVGFITRGRGITVHRADCEKVYEMIPERRISVDWADNAKNSRPVRIEIVCNDRPGLLATLSSTIAQHGVNVNRCEVFTTIDKKAVATFDLDVQNLSQLQQTTKDLKKVKGVMQIHRVDLSSRPKSQPARPEA